MNIEGKNPLLVIDADCSQFIEPLKKELSDAGLWAVQSFDLRSTRALHEGCTCPNHGTSQCTCELVVLLVYRPVGGPVTLTLDGRDGKTFVFVTDETSKTQRSSTIELIEKAIRESAYAFLHQDILIDVE